MKTLKELRNEIGTPTQEISVKTLLTTGVAHCQKELEDARITAYTNGYFVYQALGRAVRFKITDFNKLCYTTSEEGVSFDQKSLEEMDWTIWAVLYGEQRMENYIQNREQRFYRTDVQLDTTSGKLSAQEAGLGFNVADPSMDVENTVVSQDSFEYLLRGLSMHQKDCMRALYQEGKTPKEVAEEQGVTEASIRNLDLRIRKKIKKQKKF